MTVGVSVKFLRRRQYYKLTRPRQASARRTPPHRHCCRVFHSPSRRTWLPRSLDPTEIVHRSHDHTTRILYSKTGRTVRSPRCQSSIVVWPILRLFSLDPRELRAGSLRAFTASNLPSLSDFILTVCRLCAFGTKAASCVSSSAASTCALGLGILRTAVARGSYGSPLSAFPAFDVCKRSAWSSTAMRRRWHARVVASALTVTGALNAAAHHASCSKGRHAWCALAL